MASAAAKGVTPKHKNSPTYKQIVAAWLLGPTFQGAAQLVVGAFIVALFSFVRAMNFPLACTAMTLFLVMSVLVAQDLHFGSKLLGSCLVVGSGATGAVLGGCVASIAKSINYNPYTGHDQNDFYAYTAVYMCLAAFFLAILVINRVGQDPPYLWAVGMISCLSFGIVLNNGQFIPAQLPPAIDPFGNQIQYFWRQVVGRVLLDFVIAQGTAILTSLLILPTYANVELRGNVAKALAGIGNSVSKYASKALEPEDPNALYMRPMSKRMPSSTTSSTDSSASKLGHVRTTYDDDNGTLPAAGGGPDALGALRSADLDAILGEVIIEDQEEDDETVLKHLRLLSGPAMAGTMPAGPPPVSAVLKLGPPVASYRALLGRARALMPFAMIEPPFITRYVFHSDAWGRVMGACETLLTRVAGLEVVVEERRQVLGEATMECYFTVSVVPNLRLVFAEVAATCATLSRSLDPNSPTKGPRPVGGCMAMFGRSWHDTRTQLKEVMGESVRGYLRRVHLDLKAQAAGAKVHILDSTRMRAIMYTFSLTLGIIDAMEDLEKAVHALVIKTGGPRAARLAALKPGPVAEAVGEATEKTAEETAQAKDVEMGAGDAKPNPTPTSAAGAETPAVSEPVSGAVSKPAAPPAGGGHPPPQILWLLMAITLELGAPVWQGLIKWAKQDAPTVFKPGGFKAALKSRNFHVYIKYYAVLVLVMMLIQGLSARQDTVAARTYRPGIAFNAAVLSMSEKVEATVSKAALWVIGTVVGGTLGYAIMVSPEVATNPYVLMAIVCAFTFVVGATAGHQYKVLIVLSLMCFNDIVLCQYTAFPKGCTDCTGADTTYGARVLAVLLGALVPLIICNTVLPWYNSQWCLEVMGQVFVQTHAVLNAAYDKYYQEGQQAFGMSKRASSPTPAITTRVLTDGTEGKDPTKVNVQVNADEKSDEIEGEKSDGKEGSGEGQGGPEGSSDSGTVQEPTVVGFPSGPALSILQARIAGPLVGVQIALVKDAATWQRGLLATPPIVPRLLQQHFALLDRVAAVDVMLRPATITGTFSGSAFKNIVTGLHDQFKAVLDELGVIVSCSNRLMSGDVSAEAREALRVAVGVLESERLKTRAMVINHRRQFHRALACKDVDNLPYANDPDDLVRVLSFIHAYIKLLDKAVQIAGMVYGLEERSPWARIFGSSWLQ